MWWHRIRSHTVGGRHYDQYQDTVIEQTDYWYQHSSLYTAYKDCDEVLYKNPAYECSKPPKPAYSLN